MLCCVVWWVCVFSVSFLASFLYLRIFRFIIHFSIVSAQQSHISLLFHSLLLLLLGYFLGKFPKVGPYGVFNVSPRRTSIRTWYSPCHMPSWIQDRNLNLISKMEYKGWCCGVGSWGGETINWENKYQKLDELSFTFSWKVHLSNILCPVTVSVAFYCCHRRGSERGQQQGGRLAKLHCKKKKMVRI